MSLFRIKNCPITFVSDMNSSSRCHTHSKKRSSISGWRLSLNNGGYFRYTKVIYHDTKDIENLIQCEFYGALHMAYRNWLYYSWPLVNMYTSCMPHTISNAKQVLTTTRKVVFFIILFYFKSWSLEFQIVV